MLVGETNYIPIKNTLAIKGCSQEHKAMLKTCEIKIGGQRECIATAIGLKSQLKLQNMFCSMNCGY